MVTPPACRKSNMNWLWRAVKVFGEHNPGRAMLHVDSAMLYAGSAVLHVGCASIYAQEEYNVKY